MVTVKIDEDVLIDILVDRFVEYWNNGNTMDDAYELFKSYYEDLVYSGVLDGAEFDPAVIVDNDYVNYTAIVTADEISQYGYDSIEDAEDDGKILAQYGKSYLLNVT